MGNAGTAIDLSGTGMDLTVFRTYYRRVLDGLDDDAIFNCAVIRQSNNIIVTLLSNVSCRLGGYQSLSSLIE